MQSLVLQLVQTSGSRTLTSQGDASDCTKLNWPTGQTYLQNEAPLKTLSMATGAVKYPMASHAVHQGLSHKANASYDQRNITNNSTAGHLLRNQRGQE